MAPVVLKPLGTQVVRSGRSDFASGALADKLRGMALAAPAQAAAPAVFRVENLHGMSGRKCMLTGKKANNGYTVSFSHRRTKTLQQVNLQYKRVYWEREERWIRLRISTNAIKSLEKVGLEAMAKDAGLDLYSLRYEDASESRKQWLEANPGLPQAKDKRQPKFRPLGVPKPVFIPKWKQAKLDAMPEKERAAALQAFKERWFPTPKPKPVAA